MKDYKFYFFIICSIILGWYIHNYYYIHIQDRTQDVVQVRENSPDYKFINPLLFVIDTRNIEPQQYISLKNNVQDYISSAINKGYADGVSFYFRNLNQGEWIGVNENDLYYPGSLLKVSVLIAYFKLADENSSILSNPIYYTPTIDLGQTYKPSFKLNTGYYPTTDIIKQMIVYSDNDALHLLNNLHIDEILKIYRDLLLPDPVRSSDEIMSAREYSRLFRVLYNVGYISNKYSEKALDMLSKTTFKEGLVSGVASSTVVVSHKFGEFTGVNGGVVTHKELHDCGNIYYPNKPYFICVMTKGKDFKVLEKIISDISKITFEYQKNK